MTAAFPPPPQTGRADFPHPAFAGRSCTKLSQIDKSELIKVRTLRSALGRTPRTLATTPQVQRQPQPDVAVDLPKGIPAVAWSKVVRPDLEMSIELFDEVGQALEAAASIDHVAQLLTLARNRFGRSTHVPVTQLSPAAVAIQPEAVTKKVESLSLLAQIPQTRLLSV